MEHSKHEHWNQPLPYEEDNKRIAAGLLAVIFGPLGIHKFLLGYTKTGILWLFLSLISFGALTGLLGLIEGIIYLTKSDDEFYRTYQLGQKFWF